LFQPVEEADHAALAEPGERGAELRVEHDDGCNDAVLEQLLEDVRNELEIDQRRDEVRHREHEQSDEHLDRTRAGEEAEDVVERHRNEHDLDEVERSRQEVEDSAHVPACRAAWAKSSARRTGATSWTRKMEAPWSSAM